MKIDAFPVQTQQNLRIREYQQKKICFACSFPFCTGTYAYFWTKKCTVKSPYIYDANQKQHRPIHATKVREITWKLKVFDLVSIISFSFFGRVSKLFTFFKDQPFSPRVYSQKNSRKHKMEQTFSKKPCTLFSDTFLFVFFSLSLKSLSLLEITLYWFHSKIWWSLESSGMQHRVVSLKWTDLSEVSTVSIIRAIKGPDDGGSTHFWNIGPLQRDYMALHPRRL
jgi:hypothetical protein